MLKRPVDQAVATAFVVMGGNTSKPKKNRVDAPGAVPAALAVEHKAAAPELVTAKAELAAAEGKLAAAEEKLTTAKAELKEAKAGGDEDEIALAKAACARADAAVKPLQDRVNTLTGTCWSRRI